MKPTVTASIAAAVGIVTLIIRERGDLINQLDRTRDRLAFLNAKSAPTIDDAEEKEFLRAQVKRLQERLEQLSK